MTPQETQLVDDLFDRLAKLETTPRDPEAERLMTEALRRAPHAVYSLVQTALVQDEALKRANARIEEVQAQVSARGTAGKPPNSSRQASSAPCAKRLQDAYPLARFGAERARVGARHSAAEQSIARPSTAAGLSAATTGSPMPPALPSAPADRFSAPRPRPPPA